MECFFTRRKTVCTFSFSSPLAVLIIPTTRNSDKIVQYLSKLIVLYSEWCDLHGVSNHRQLDCLFKNLFPLTSKRHQRSALLVLCVRGTTVDRWIPCTKGQWWGKCFYVIVFLLFESSRIMPRWPVGLCRRLTTCGSTCLSAIDKRLGAYFVKHIWAHNWIHLKILDVVILMLQLCRQLS